MRTERILVVEDERIIAIDLQRRLEKVGFSVSGIASTGADAIRLSREGRPDIILMDIMLAGGIDGIEAAKVIRQSLDIPVIFLTAYSDDATFERAKAAEPFGYILKPFKERELYSTIDIALYKHRTDNELKRQERWLSAILHSVGEGVIATDVRNKVQFMNPVAESITGWQESEARDRPVLEIIRATAGKPAFSLEPLDDPEGGPLALSATTIESKQGREVQVEGSVSRIRGGDGMVEGRVFVLRDITAVRRMSETIDFQATHDALTGLENRELFSRRLEALIDDARQRGRAHALMLLNLDQFKVINETCGHAAGDELLRETTSIIRTVVRASDACGRLGADEFAIILENCGAERAEFIAQRLAANVSRNKFEWESRVFSISSSIGLVMIESGRKDVGALLSAADGACHAAKKMGGNRIHVYRETDTYLVQRRGEMEWIAKLGRALEEGSFLLYYQPIVPINPANGAPKCEILLRLRDEGRVVAPADFLSAAERYNYMPRIDRWVISSTISAYRAIRESDSHELRDSMFCVNLSGASIADETLLPFIRAQFEASGAPPSAFCFEVTETAAIHNITSAVRFVSELKKLGCSLSLDDFGSGFSSFSYLKNLPIDFLKIDGSFVQDMIVDPIDRSMVEAIHNLGKLMGVRTVAEFVSSAEIFASLAEIGVDYAQGYHIAEPALLPGVDVVDRVHADLA